MENTDVTVGSGVQVDQNTSPRTDTWGWVPHALADVSKAVVALSRSWYLKTLFCSNLFLLACAESPCSVSLAMETKPPWQPPNGRNDALRVVQGKTLIKAA